MGFVSTITNINRYAAPGVRCTVDFMSTDSTPEEQPCTPSWRNNTPWCSYNICRQFDGKRCKVTGFKLESVCVPCVKIAYAQLRRQLNEDISEPSTQGVMWSRLVGLYDLDYERAWQGVRDAWDVLSKECPSVPGEGYVFTYGMALERAQQDRLKELEINAPCPNPQCDFVATKSSHSDCPKCGHWILPQQ